MNTKHLNLGLCLVIASTACGKDASKPAAQPAAIGAGVALVLTTTYETSAVDAFSTDDPTKLRQNLVVASGDAVLRKIGDRAVVLNRGDASSIQVVGNNLSAGQQIALPGCSPHDAVLLADGRILVSCYDDDFMRAVDLSSETATEVVDLSATADADGIPEMDQMLVIGDTLYLTLQLLDRANYYAPTDNGQVASINLSDLTLVDTDLNTAGVQSHALSLPNPYTRLATDSTGRLLVACAGDWANASTMGVVALDVSTGANQVVVTGAALGGTPNGLAVGPADQIYVLVSIGEGFNTTEMQVLDATTTTPVMLHSYAGFSLAGLAADAQGRLFVGNRSDGPDAGIWAIDVTSKAADGPYTTGLPPFDIVTF